MDWMNLHISTLDSPAFKGAEPVDRATWLCLLRFCVGQENGGVIQNAGAWGDRKWQQLCGVTKIEAHRDCDLWSWQDGSLHVAFYPVDKESEVKAKRMAGRQGANSRWHGTPIDKPYAEGRNSNEKEIEGEGKSDSCTTSIFQVGKKAAIDTSQLLAEFGLPSARWHASEWRGGLNKIARCKSIEEARAFMAWAISVCKAQGAECEYFRHVKLLASEWDNGQRTKHFGAISEV
jgi:hypothetical protein